MNQEQLAAHPYIKQILELNRLHEDRKVLHEKAGPVLQLMGNDTGASTTFRFYTFLKTKMW
jgi:hypothetical protein